MTKCIQSIAEREWGHQAEIAYETSHFKCTTYSVLHYSAVSNAYCVASAISVCANKWTKRIKQTADEPAVVCGRQVRSIRYWYVLCPKSVLAGVRSVAFLCTQHWLVLKLKSTATHDDSRMQTSRHECSVYVRIRTPYLEYWSTDEVHLGTQSASTATTVAT